MNDNQSLLLEIAQRIAAGGSLGAMLPDILNATLRLAGADGIRLVLNISPMPMVYVSGAAAAKMVKFDAVIADVLADQESLIISNVNEAQKKLRNRIEDFRDLFGAMLALPLTAQQTTHGLLWMAYEEPQQFDAEALTYLRILAAQMAVAIANSRAVDEARRRRQQLAAILTSSADPILVVDEKSAILVLNPAAEAALQVDADAAMGKPIADVIAVPPLVDLLEGSARNGEGVEWQNEAGHFFFPNVSEIHNEQGELAGRVLLLRDITRYRNLRDNQSEFVSTVSHDLRSPLTYMHGYATMLPMVGELNEKQKSFAEKIILGIAQMTDLVDKILDASRLDPDGNYELNREACDVTKIVNDIVGNHQQAAEKKNISLISDMPTGVPILNLDDVMVRRALNNLVDNAIKYTPDNGSVTVSAGVQDNNLMLAVSDTGLGISEENQKHLFERFRRVRRREHQTIKGNGLGLFIVKSVAQKHGGDAWVESVEGQGSTFAIRIPLEGVNLLGAESKRDGSVEKVAE
ncbi:MAG TPA: ATP-binding protein [Aggregatilineales bacterium]|nr:ATP-binding protein [Aggregatilineales bacterium]